jgi:hypothetical protein
MAESAILLERALTVRGLSGKSYGVAFRSKKRGAALQDDFRKHMATPMCAPELIDSTALAVHIASIKLRAIQRFSELAHIRISIPEVLAGILTELNEDADRYDDLVADARALATKYQLDPNTIKVPPKAAVAQAKQWGITYLPEGRATLAINGEPLTIGDIYRASLCVYSILG